MQSRLPRGSDQDELRATAGPTQPTRQATLASSKRGADTIDATDSTSSRSEDELQGSTVKMNFREWRSEDELQASAGPTQPTQLTEKAPDEKMNFRDVR